MKKLKFVVKLFAMVSLVVIVAASIVIGLLLDKQTFFEVVGSTNLIVYIVSKVFVLLAISAYLFVCVWKEQEIGFAQVSFLVAMQLIPTGVRLLLKLNSYGIILSVVTMFLALLLLEIIIFGPLVKEIKEDEARQKNFDDNGQFKGPGI
ncbi:MAG: hypothetical protein PHT83_02025 [Bacilli bacterium]|nr:hypothetical protein [Bacilli bacterium]